MMIKSLSSEVLDVPMGEHFESPIWDDGDERLIWVDIFRGEVHAYLPGSALHRVTQVGSEVGAVGLARSGELVLAVRAGFVLLTERTQVVQPLALPLKQTPEVRMNDGACDARGRFWAGSMAYDAIPGRGTLYCLRSDGTLTVAIDSVTISNGIAWDPTWRLCYYIDSATGCVDAFEFDLEEGRLGARQTVIDLRGFPYEPDGLTVDADGAIWVALWDGSEVQRYSPSGELLARVRLPVSRVTSCTFGGRTLQQLYITTSRFGLDAAALISQPLAGSVFVVDAAVQGLPAQRFGTTSNAANSERNVC
jgi:sugar lactone lactonase YvrE